MRRQKSSTRLLGNDFPEDIGVVAPIGVPEISLLVFTHCATLIDQDLRPHPPIPNFPHTRLLI